MNSQHFFCDKKNLRFLLDSEQSNILSSGKLDKILIKNKIDLREINQIIKDNNKFYNFSKINDNFSKNLIKSNSKTKPKVLDLFCGAGGFSKGFDMSGFNISHSIDMNKVFIKTHKINFKESNSLSVDLNNFNPENLNLKKHHFDVIIGSPPCQTFSSIGQGKIKSLNKDIKKDIRNYLYSNFIKFVDFFQPKFFLLENVPGFKSKYNGEMFKDFINKLKNIYDISSDIINAKNFNVPQSRKRLFIFGQLKTCKKKLMIFDGINNIKDKNFTVNDAISDLPKITDDWRLDSLFYSKDNQLNEYQKKMRVKTGTIVKNNICRISNPEAKKLFSYLKPGEKYIDLTKEIKKKNNLLKNFQSKIIHHRIKRLPLRDISWTIIAHIGMDGYEYVHPTENRTLSVREAARIQGFPDDFVFTGNMREQYIQVGNAVSPLVSEYFANKIYNFCKF